MSVFDRITDYSRDIPIRKKLLLIVLLIINIALILSSTAVVLYDRKSKKLDLSQQINILTQVIAQRSTAALAFDDKHLAAENLQTLSANNSIITACIYDSDNHLFSQYLNSAKTNGRCDTVFTNPKKGYVNNYLFVNQDIVLDELIIGSIYIQSSLDEINERLINYVIFVVLIFLVSGFIAFLLAVKLQKLITNPIADLSNAARKICDQKDYSIRVEKSTNDEVGGLVEAFNDMLQVTEKRDAALVDAKENLENLVKERTSKLKEAQDELVRTERMATLGQLTATVSHEIRNPLGTIRTSVYTLSNKLMGKDPSINNIIERIERNIVRCDNIITELLDYSRIRALQHERTNISSWIRSILMDMTIPDDVKINDELIDSIDIEIDRDLLQRVIINIIENGFQALNESVSKEHTLTFEIILNESTTEINISDNGDGIPEDVYPHIFEPLYSTKSFGVGLGLPIVKQIMEQHGGGIDIISEKGVGTKVVLWLPAALTISKDIVRDNYSDRA